MADPFAARVLLVDDEPHIRTYLRHIIRDLGATEVHEAGDGAAAVAAYQQIAPDLVLLDFNLPGEDGLAVLQRLLALDPEARVIMMTVVASREVVEKCADAGALNYIRKDTPREAIARALRETWNETLQE